MKRATVTKEHLGILGDSVRALPLIDGVPLEIEDEPGTREVVVVLKERRSKDGAKLRELINIEQAAIKHGGPSVQAAMDAVYSERLRLEQPKVWNHWPRAKQ